MADKLDIINDLLNGCERSLRALEHADLALDAILPEEEFDIDEDDETEIEGIVTSFKALEKLRNGKG